MTTSRKSVVLVCVVVLLAACSTSSYSTNPPGDPMIAREARALGLSYLEAIEGAADCAAIGPRLDAAFASQGARIDMLANARVRFADGPTKEEQSRLLKAAEKVKGCGGKIQASAAAQAVAPLGKLVRRLISSRCGPRERGHYAGSRSCARSSARSSRHPGSTTSCTN